MEKRRSLFVIQNKKLGIAKKRNNKKSVFLYFQYFIIILEKSVL